MMLILHSWKSPGSQGYLTNNETLKKQVTRYFFTIVVQCSNVLRHGSFAVRTRLQTRLRFDIQQSIFDLVSFFVVLKSGGVGGGGHLLAMSSKIEVVPFHEGPLFTSAASEKRRRHTRSLQGPPRPCKHTGRPSKIGNYVAGQFYTTWKKFPYLKWKFQEFEDYFLCVIIENGLIFLRHILKE